MAESLEVGNASVEALGNLLTVSLSEVWTPDAAFFDQLRDKQAINAMLADIAGLSGVLKGCHSPRSHHHCQM